MNGEEWLNQRGGIYILYGDQMRSEERTLLQTAARVVLNGHKGSLGNQMPGYSIPVHHLTRIYRQPGIKKMQRMRHNPLTPFLWRKRVSSKFYNGYGGFSADGREYIIELPPGKTTPAPWVNVIGYPEFGFMVSEAGSQCTWALNSGENRLHPGRMTRFAIQPAKRFIYGMKKPVRYGPQRPCPLARANLTASHMAQVIPLLSTTRMAFVRSDTFCQPGRSGQNYPSKGGEYFSPHSPDHRHAIC